MSVISVVDYGMGNIGSVKNIFKYLGYKCNTVYTKEEIQEAGIIVLPGVGNFRKAIGNIQKAGIDKALEYAVYEKKSRLLGICLGMQLLFDYSEEGECRGLGFIKGNVYRFNNIGLNIPHMGWNTISLSEDMKEIFYKENARYYFVHSYYAECKYKENIMATTEYGIKFHSAVKKDNIIGVQFHPEKSNIYGMDFLRKYMEMA